MKKTIFLTPALIFTVILFSCKSDTVTNSNGINPLDTSAFIFPFETGNSWTYTEKEYATDIHPDSILPHFIGYPKTWNGAVTILYDTLINNIQTRCFLEVISDAQTTRHSRTYLINNDTALQMYAQRGGGFLVNPPEDKSGKIKYNLDRTDETIRIYDPPYILLKYPVVTGKSWSVYGTDTLTKKYEGYETISIGAGYFKCMKTKTILPYLTETPWYDYYCRFGLLKRSVTYNDIVITTEWFPEGIGTADITFISSVNSINVR